jgi:predicted permease
MLTGLAQDLRSAVRQLSRAPGFSLALVVSLAIGIAGNTTVFSVVNSLLFRPLPFSDPGRLVSVYTSDFSSGEYGTSAYPDYKDFQRQLPGLASLAALKQRYTSMITGDRSEPVALGQVSFNFFAALGTPPALGRDFLPEEDSVAGSASVVILGHAMWQTRFGASPSVLGQVVNLGGSPFQVIGVAPASLDGPVRGVQYDAWAPLSAEPILEPGSDDLTSRGARSLELVGRLAPGATLALVTQGADRLAADLFRQYPNHWRTVKNEGRRITVIPEADSRVAPNFRGAALGVSGLMLLVVALVLVIVCSNLANLLLARGVARQHELAVRLALGAGRGRLLRLLLMESLLLAILGGVAAYGLTQWGAAGLNALLPSFRLPISLVIEPDWRSMLFAAVVTLLTGIGLGLAPAFGASRTAPSAALHRSATATREISRVQSVLVVSQVSLSLVLVLIAGLLARSLSRALDIDPGFGLRQGLIAGINLRLNGTWNDARRRELLDRIVEGARQLPGVQSATVATRAPVTPGRNRQWVTVEGYTPAPGEDMEFPVTRVGEGYFETLQAPLVRGHGIGREEATGAAGGVVVNEAFVRRFWPDRDPLAQRVSVSGREGPFEPVVGVAADIKYSSLSDEAGPAFYSALARRPGSAGVIILATSVDPASLARPLTALIRSIDPTIPAPRINTLAEHLDRSLLPSRVAGAFVGGFGVLGMLVAGIGLTGVLAYLVAQRFREIGIRLALGATAAEVVRLVVGRGLKLAGAGLILGLILALPVAGLLRGMLYGLSPFDPLTYLGISLLFVLVSIAACWMPARRAARVDPMISLRTE